jgi:hypothetical protein
MDWFFLSPLRYTQTYPQKLGKPLGAQKSCYFKWQKVRKTGFASLGGIYRGQISTGNTGLF